MQVDALGGFSPLNERRVVPNADGASDCASSSSDDAPKPSKAKPKAKGKGGMKEAMKEKQDASQGIGDSATNANTFDELADAFDNLLKLLRDYRHGTAASFVSLDAFGKRLCAPHEFPRPGETAESFSAILTKSLVAPIQLMSAQLQAQHKALQSLSASVDSVKKSHATNSYASVASASLASPPATSPARPRPVPLTSTPDERLLLRYDGTSPPPLFTAPYHCLVPDANAILAPLGLLKILEVATLTKAWQQWGPIAFPGTHIVPPATYSHIQVNRIPHAAAPDLNSLAKELMERHPELGQVVGTPVWVNPPPSEAQISATVASGRKPRTAGSVFIHLTSREKVDIAVAAGCLHLAGSAPSPTSTSPNAGAATSLAMSRRDAQLRKRNAAGVGKQRTVKRVAESLQLQAVDLTNHLNATSDGEFGVICVQEPHHNEVLNSHDFPHYAIIYPDTFEKHRVSTYIKLSSVSPANICPRPDLSTSGDIMTSSVTSSADWIPLMKIFLVMDSNSHHPHWDLNTKTPLCEEDFELHDLLMSYSLLLLTLPDIPTHISGNIIDLRFCSPALFMSINATVDSSHCVGSDHLPIHYSLDFEVARFKSMKFNSAKMDLDIFHAALKAKLEGRPVPTISTLEELNLAADFINSVLLEALMASTPHHRPCSAAKRWWTDQLTCLRRSMRNWWRKYQRTRVPSARTEWLTARCAFYRGIVEAKQEVWATFLKELERIDIYCALNRLKEHCSAVFPAINDPTSGAMALTHANRGLS
ncbi:hypothetical protein K438DRAFT_1990395 [Mycena galopus ATCC 62051]|nr:hypothetical protein K438DRAFT_1990395 [Mycena galopus ATCC 62051]